jgi:sugar lactone lactonase YvrE
MTLLRLLSSLLPLTLGAASAAAQGRSPSPSYEQIGALVQGGLDALARGDTGGYLDGTRKAFAIAPRVPPVAYHHARAHALAGTNDSALALLARLAVEGAVVVDEAPADSAFDRLRRSRRWSEVAASIESSRRPISTSTTAFELPERDLTAEGTAWDAKTGTLYLSSLYKRKIVTIGPDGTARDFITPGQDGIGPVVGIEVDAARRGLWAASMVLQEAGIPLSDTTFMAHGLLFHYDVDTGRLRRRYVLKPTGERRHGFNDLTVMPNGDVYVTDSQSGGIYKLSAGAGEVVEVLPPGTYTFPNGITRTEDGRLLFVAHGAGVDRIEVGTGRRLRLASPDILNLGGIDGLAFHHNTLIAHQPGWFNRVVRLRLDPGQERIASWEVLERHHPRFRQPTTGEVAGDLYYYIANAQLRSFRDGKILPWDSLAPVLVLKTDLSDARPKAGEAVREALRSGAAPGAAVAVGRSGNVIWSEGFGARDLATGRLVAPGTKFGVGSISKTLTLAAALALADAARLDLDAPVERYLPDFPHPGQGVTVRRIGAHQSGIADDFANDHYWSSALRAGQRLSSDRRGAHGLFTRHTDGVRDRSLHDRRQGAGTRRRGTIRGGDAADGVRAGRHGGNDTERPAAASRRANGVLRERGSRLRAGTRLRSQLQAAGGGLSLHRRGPGAVRDGAARAGAAVGAGETGDVHASRARGWHTNPLRARLSGAGGRRPATAAAIRRRARDLELARDLSRGAAGRRPPRQCHGRASGPDRAPRGPELPHTSRTRATAPAPTGAGAGAVSSGGTLTRSFALRRPSRSWRASK